VVLLTETAAKSSARRGRGTTQRERNQAPFTAWTSLLDTRGVEIGQEKSDATSDKRRFREREPISNNAPPHRIPSAPRLPAGLIRHRPRVQPRATRRPASHVIARAARHRRLSDVTARLARHRPRRATARATACHARHRRAPALASPALGGTRARRPKAEHAGRTTPPPRGGNRNYFNPTQGSECGGFRAVAAFARSKRGRFSRAGFRSNP